MNVTLRANARADNEIAVLRLVAGMFMLGCVAWLMSTGAFTPLYIVVVVALLAGLGWIASARRIRKRAARADDEYLVVDDGGVCLTTPAGTHRIPWSDVQTIAADDERLDVVITHACGELRIEPRFGELGTYALADLLTQAQVEHSNRDTLR